MKALIYRHKNTMENFGLELADVPEPELRDTDLLIELVAIGINPGDTQIRQNTEPEPGGYIILGYEFSGIVKKAGRHTKGFQAGDRVFGIGDFMRNGAYAEQMAVDYRNVNTFPSGSPFDHAAAVPLVTLTAWQSIFRVNGQLPEDVKNIMIVGAAGGVGSMALQLLKARSSVRIIATASRPESSAWCRKMGADEVINHHEEILPQLRAIGLEEVDMVFSVNGLKDSIRWVPEVIRPYGYFAIIDLQGAVDLGKLMQKSVTIFLEMVFTRSIYHYQSELPAKVLAELIELVKAGKISAPGTTIFRGLTVENMKEAHAMIENGNVIGKIVLMVAE
ncbi:zinc-binding alcohol dehydrogenase family protein [Mucilaginibacter celer]|uniref:Zinc-type alcohol dehydrogenase-like protein n=1 Tax=Mucilaginibacter celer TaxID=2305508 RepID=A0A494VLH5_9SPHI|nr:zinc-binding alcohol dehydrogenase family protein [Mucilaginibacter celer]AYL95384.1 zinc-binding alcohol dehydrogenase family protein [Mucilaginibacter celer]